MQSITFVVASLALLSLSVCAPVEDVIQHIPKAVAIPSSTERNGASSGAVVNAGSEPLLAARARRDLGGQESDLLPSAKDIDASPFGEVSQLDGRGRIKVLPAYLG
ncbi:unnamed protein product [Danaus chrysippus]|uniref:(African queen) hypothetical protein n=1 Tax=Danaus chrysippus TaxID=151541 RepID=A0A8J2W1N8_9NEOP|nr:unnamed protein product [Danaus chrysippus]